MAPATDPTTRLKGVLLANPKGIGITEIAKKAGMHRSVAVKYLEFLRASGQVEMRRAGMAKLYTLSRRVPLSATLDFKEDILIILDENSRVVQVNECYEVFCGQSRDSVVGKSMGNSDLPILADPEIANIVRSLENPQILLRSYFMAGEENARNYRIRLIPTVFEGGKTGVTVIGVDISKEQEISHKIFAAETQYRTMIDRLPNPICVFSPDMMITQSNRAFREWFFDNPLLDQPETVNEGCFADIVYGSNIGRKDDMTASIRRNALPPSHEHQVCINGEGSAEERQSRWLRWYYSPEYSEDGALIKIQATGIEITREKGLERELAEKNRWIEFLSRKSLEFTELSSETDIYGNICEGVLEVVPDAVISHSSYDPTTGSLTVRSIMGDHENILGRYFPGSIGLSIPLKDPEAIQMMRSGKLHTIPGGLHVATFGQIPPLLCSRIEEKIHWVSTWGIGLASQGYLLSAMVLLKCGNGPLNHEETLEAYARVSSLALRKWLLEREKRASE